MNNASSEPPESRELLQEQADRLRWLIMLRFVAVIGVAIADFSTQIVGYTQTAPGIVPWLVVPFALGYNLAFWLWLRLLDRAAGRQWRMQHHLHWMLFLQALCDILALNLLVYINGGIEYPLFYAPVVAILLTGLLLPRWAVFVQANLGALLFGLMALGEWMGWLPHIFFLNQEYRHGLYLDWRAALGISLSVAIILNVAAFLVSSVGQRLRQAEGRTRSLLASLRQQVRAAAGQLAQSAEELRSASEGVNRVAEQIALTVQQIAQGAGEQAGQLERLSANLGHLTETAQRVAAGAQEAQAASAESVSEANRGRQAAEEATARMQEISRVFALAEESMAALARRSEEISEVALAIDRFAERTDLLALNASIEAARAGEHGRGFAVVAGEVKKLAANSSASAARVGEIVAQVQARIAEVVSAMRAGMERVREGEAGIGVLRQVVEGMAEVIRRTDGLVGTMEHLARQQMEAHREMVQVAGEIAGGAEETAAGAEEAAAAVEEQVASFSEFGRAVRELAGLAQRLEQAVADLSNASVSPQTGIRRGR